MNVEAIVLAAGQGTRMKSNLPKVLHQLAGKSLLAYVLDAAGSLGAYRIHTVVGHGAQKVEESFRQTQGVSWVRQTEQLGTGHAVLQAMPGVDPDSTVLILYGDVPMLARSTLDQMLELAGPMEVALLTVTLEDPTGYGRILRDDSGQVRGIVEEKDCTEGQRAVREVNTGIMAMGARELARWLPTLDNKNAQGEYYLTDLIEIAASEGYRIRTCQPGVVQEVEGINSRQQLAAMERWYQRQIAEELMASGASLIDPARLDVRGILEVGRDVCIDVNVVVEGSVVLGNGVNIGPNCVLADCRIGDGSTILANCVIEGAEVASSATIGPFARLRPGTEVRPGAKIGNFVETKNTTVGVGSKINHLSYVGDTRIGEGANIGAGTITCNYDGASKHQTLIGDRAFVGSNSSLVAPVSIGNGATVGAGSTVVKNVEDEELAVARARQKNVQGWKRPSKSPR